MKQDQIIPLPLTLTVRLGIRHLPIKRLTRLRPGDVLELDRALGQPLEMVVAGQVIGRCQVISLGEKLGIRIVELFRTSVPAGPAPSSTGCARG